MMNVRKFAIIFAVAAVFIAICIFYSHNKSKIDSSLPVSQAEDRIPSVQSCYVAVVNLRKVVVESKAGISIENQISEINESSKSKLQEVESRMKAIEKDKLAEGDARKTEDMQFALYDMVKKKRSQISMAYKNAVLELETAINSVLKQIAEQEGISMIINSEAVACINDNNCRDVTSDVIKKLDDILPHIQVKMEQQ